jgi:cytochrome c biogenesis protein CcdA
MAIASLVTGILGFLGPVVFSLIAIFTGYAARKETRAQPPRVSGDGFATAGIIMGWIQIGLAALAICLTLVLLLLGVGIFGSMLSR